MDKEQEIKNLKARKKYIYSVYDLTKSILKSLPNNQNLNDEQRAEFITIYKNLNLESKQKIKELNNDIKKLKGELYE